MYTVGRGDILYIMYMCTYFIIITGIQLCSRYIHKECLWSNSTLFFVKGWECTASRHFPEERALSEDVLHIHSRVWQECGSTGRADEEEPGIRRGGSGIWGNEACLTSFHRLRGRVCLVTEVPLLMLVNVRLLPEICVLFFVCVS